MSKKIVAVDSGKYATKAKLKGDGNEADRRIAFRTKMDPTQEDKASDGYSCVFEYEGKRYLIGREAETANYETSKAKDIHKYSTYAAIAQLVNDGDSVQLAIGCPLSVYFNVDERKAYRKFMVETGDINVILDGKSKTFNISDAFVCAEGSGILWKNPGKYKNSLVGIIDIGGLNSNFCIYDKLAPVKSSYGTTNLGANIMRNELRQKLNSAFKDVNIQEWQIEDILSKGFIKSNKEESAVIISEFLQAHILKILEECKKKGWDINNIDLIFVGGGSKLFESEIKKLIPDAEISEDAEWDNVDGFAALAGVKYGE